MRMIILMDEVSAKAKRDKVVDNDRDDKRKLLYFMAQEGMK